METPIIIINFKTYEEATGHNAVNLAKACEEASLEMNQPVSLAVQDTDLYRVSQSVSLPILAEHIDVAGLGGFTGKITPLGVLENGAVGTLINHSEDRVPFPIIEKLVNICRENNLISVVCAQDVEEAKKFAIISPDFIAVEPPELIGGDISVSTAKPEIISDTVRIVNSISSTTKVLCGAGVKTEEDVRIAIHLGAKGVLLASGITKATNPKEKLKELLKGLK